MDEEGPHGVQRKSSEAYLTEDDCDQRESGRIYLWSTTLLLYFTSLLLPGARLSELGSETDRGIFLLAFGAFGFMYGEIRWSANVRFLIGLILVGVGSPRRNLAVVILSAAAALAASCIVLPPHIPVGAGNYRIVSAPLAIGGYIWILSHLSAVVLALKSRSTESWR